MSTPSDLLKFHKQRLIDHASALFGNAIQSGQIKIQKKPRLTEKDLTPAIRITRMSVVGPVPISTEGNVQYTITIAIVLILAGNADLSLQDRATDWFEAIGKLLNDPAAVQQGCPSVWQTQIDTEKVFDTSKLDDNFDYQSIVLTHLSDESRN